MKIGKLVKHSIPLIFSCCDDGEREKIDYLLDKKYSKEVFGISYPFCMEIDKITPELHPRFWARIYLIKGKKVRVTNDWYDKDKPSFRAYLASKGIVPNFTLDHPELADSKLPTSPTAKNNVRYRGNPIGNAQNLFIRNILSNIGDESFSKKDWDLTKDYFSHCCAYCGAKESLDMEHAIPINKEKLGEHRLGNLVPSCKNCNKNKHDQDFREFLKGKPEAEARIHRIEIYMNGKNYRPLEGNQQIKNILDMAHKEVAAMADRYIAIINELELFVQKTDHGI